MAEVQGPTIYFDAQIRGLDKVADDLKRSVSTNATKQFGRLAEKIEGVTDGFDKMRGAVDATGDTLRLFGIQGVRVANAIEDISDPARRATLSLAMLREQASPGRLMRFNRALSDTQAELALTRAQLGPVGGALEALALAAGAAMLAMGAFVTKGLKRIIDESPRATGELERLNDKMGDLQEGAARVALGHADVADAMAGANIVTDRLDGSIERASGGMTNMEDALQAVWIGFKIANPVIGLGGAALTALSAVGRDASTVMGDLASVVSDAAGSFDGLADSALSALDTIESRAVGALNSVLDLGAEILAAQQKKMQQRRRRRGGGGGGARRRREERRAAEIAAITGPATTGLEFALQRAAERGVGAQAQGAASPIGQANAQLTETARLLGEIDTQALATRGAMDNLAQSVGGALAQSFLDLGSTVGVALGQFAIGASSLAEFGQAIQGLFSDLSSTIGDFFLKTGLGMLFINPGAGAGLIAAGIGLKALSGILGGAGAGGGSRGSGGGAAAASTDPSRFLRPERSMEPSVTNLKVVILGEEIERPVTRFMDDVARRGGFRNLQTRT